MVDPSPKPWKRLVPFLIGGLLGAAVLLYLLRTPGEELTPAGLEAARQLWNRHGLRHYRMIVDIEGSQHGLHEITVRNGKAVSMTTEGASVPEAVRDYWTVEGMLRFLEEELMAREDPERVHGVTDPEQIVLRVQFDRDRGYPRRFLRHVLGRGGAIRWEIRSFEATGTAP